MADLSRAFRDRAERIAVAERRSLNLPGYAPLGGEVLATAHGVRVLSPHDLIALAPEVCAAFLAQKINGLLLCGANLPPLIVLHPDQSPPRRQSTLMHEMAHFLLGHGGVVRNAAQEREAAYLGGCLQLPRVALRWAAQIGLSREQVCERFGASKAMVHYRENVTGERLKPRRPEPTTAPAP